MERLDTLKITLVFIVSIVLPSVLLSFLAVKAISNEREAMLQRIGRRFTERTDTIARGVEDRLRAAVEAAAATARSTAGQNLSSQEIRAAFERALPDRDLFPVFFLMDERGDVHEPRDLPRLAGWTGFIEEEQLAGAGSDGGDGVPPGLAEALRMRREGDLGGAIDAIRRSLREGVFEAPDRALLLLVLGESYLRRSDEALADLYNAADQFDGVLRDHRDVPNPRGIPVAAVASLHLAEIAARHRNEERANRAVDGLEELAGPRRDDLAPADLAALAACAANGLGDGPVASRLRSIAEDARSLVARRSALGQLVEEGHHAGHLLSLLDRGFDGDSIAGFDVALPESGRHAILYAILPGGASGRPRGVAGFEVDLAWARAELLTPAVETADLQEPEGTLEVVAAGGPPGDAAATRPLAPPLDHLMIVARAEPTAPADALRGTFAEGIFGPLDENILFWAIVVCFGAIAAGVLVTIRAVLHEKWESGLKTDFVTTVTHELKTPLTSIGMFVETLQMGRIKDEAEAKECLDIMARETKRLTAFIERVLRFSKLEAHKERFEYRLCDLKGVVEETIEIFRKHHLPEGGPPVDIDLSFLQEETGRVLMDRAAIQEVLLNLLSNAYKYGGCDAYGNPRPKWIRVHIKLRRRQALIEVEDNGPGIAAKERRRIFRKFYRAPDVTIRGIEGSGIGLTLARTIARAHRGDVWCTSKVGVGSKFTLALPR